MACHLHETQTETVTELEQPWDHCISTKTSFSLNQPECLPRVRYCTRPWKKGWTNQTRSLPVGGLHLVRCWWQNGVGQGSVSRNVKPEFNPEAALETNWNIFYTTNSLCSWNCQGHQRWNKYPVSNETKEIWQQGDTTSCPLGRLLSKRLDITSVSRMWRK